MRDFNNTRESRKPDVSQIPKARERETLRQMVDIDPRREGSGANLVGGKYRERCVTGCYMFRRSLEDKEGRGNGVQGEQNVARREI